VKNRFQNLPFECNLHRYIWARQAERAAAVAAGNLKGAASTDASAEKKSQIEYAKGVTAWNFNMDEIRSEAGLSLPRVRLATRTTLAVINWYFDCKLT
jgi:hypothetical protein